MARVVTETGVANLALSLIKTDPVASISPPDPRSKAAKLAAQWYDDARREVLSEHDWKHATKRVLIPAGTAPAFGRWANSYALPPDFIRLTAVGNEDHPLDADDYLIENGAIFCNEAAPLPLIYVYDLDDVAKFTPKFLIAFAKKLAFYISIGLTGSMNMAGAMNEIAETDISDAKALSSQGSPPRKVQKSRWAAAKIVGHVDRGV